MFFKNKGKKNSVINLSKYENKKPTYLEKERKAIVNKRKWNFDIEKKSFVSEESSKSGHAKIMCVGDIMCEQKMYNAYNFDDVFLPHNIFYYVKKLFKEADFVVGNLETILYEKAPYTGEQYKIDGKYHCNAPASYLDALRYAGFDMFITSNNHNLDCGVNGIAHTIRNIDNGNFLQIGLFTDPTEIKRHCIVDINGIKVAFLAYSTWFNRNLDRLTDKGKGLISIYDADRVKKDLYNAKKDGAEYSIVYMHWGVDREYRHDYGDSQKKQAIEIAEAGADYIVGTHTHSLQGYDEVTCESGRTVPVMYSLGNFATSEINYLSRDNAVLCISLDRNENGRITAESKYVPCHVFDNFNGRKYPIVPALKRYNENSNSEYLIKTRNLAEKLMKRQIKEYNAEIDEMFSKALIYEAEGKVLGEKEDNERYTCLRFAQDAVEGCAAFVPVTSNPRITFSEEQTVSMAENAVKKDCKVLISDRQIRDYNCIIVKDVWKTWVNIHKILRDNYNGTVIGITGSIGKTSMTGMLISVLKSKFEVHGSDSNINTVRYSSIILQKLKNKHDIYVQELAEGPPYGCAENISQFIKPDIGVITRVGSSHMEEFGSKEKVAESCFGIEVGMNNCGKIYINADDKYQMNYKNIKHDAIYYGIENDSAEYKANNIIHNIDSISFNLEYNNKSVKIKLNCIGMHNVYNALSTFAVAKELGMKDDEIVNALSKYKTSGLRQNLTTICGQKLFLDCYNASSESIKGALESFDFIKKNNHIKTIAIIGDVLELGEQSEKEHEKIGEYILLAFNFFNQYRLS